MTSDAKPARAPSEEATSDYWSLVNRLRRAAAPRHDPLQETDLYTEAADEIERLNKAAHRLSTALDLCAAAYQVIGALSYLTGTKDHPDVIRALNNLAEPENPPHADLLPWPKTQEGLKRIDPDALLNPSEELQEDLSEAFDEAFLPAWRECIAKHGRHDVLPAWASWGPKFFRVAAMKITGRTTE